jgi:hypothetical protein
MKNTHSNFHKSHGKIRCATRPSSFLFYGGTNNGMNAVLVRNTSILKKSIFSRSLRNLSLPEQVASIESLLFVVLKAPKVFSLSDNLVLAYLLDLLKMLGVADKEMTSESVSLALVSDKDGYCPTDERNDNMINGNAYITHIPHRSSCKMKSFSMTLILAFGY